MRSVTVNKKRRTALKLTASIFILVFIWLASGILVSDNLQIEKIEVTVSEGATTLKIAQISDIHFPDSKIPLDQIADIIARFNPDLVFMTGDVLDSSATREDIRDFSTFTAKLKPYLVYAVLGNHELILRNLKNYKSDLEDNGITLLENEARTITIKNRTIAVAGISDKESYGYLAVNNLSSVPQGSPILLLAHRPEKWENYLSATAAHKPTAVFSGHAHGGQLKIFGKGLYAPGYGYFPKYYDGLYKDKASGNILVVSRGLGDSIFPFRLYNKYHLPLITITV